MLDCLTGEILYKRENNICTLSVNGIGFSLNILSKDWDYININQQYLIFIATHLTADVQVLYGFIDELERDVFLLLSSIKGIGYKLSLNILENISLNNLVYAVENEDYKLFTQAKGIGEKSAQKIVFDLKHKLKKLKDKTGFSDNSVQITGEIKLSKYKEEIQDITEILISLGYKKKEIDSCVKNNINQYTKNSEDEFLKICLETLG